MRSRRAPLLRLRLAAAGTAAACLAAGACAAEAGSSSTAAAGTAKASGSCGTVSFKSPGGSADLNGLPASIRAGYNGYFAPVDTSAYENFATKGGAPYSIGYSDSFSANTWRGDALARLRSDVAAYKSDGLVGGLTTADSNLDNTLQIQQITSMIDQHVSAIIAIPNSPTAFDGVIKQAYDAGIPFITVDSHVDSPYAINIDTNYFLTGELVAAKLAEIIDGKGQVAIVDGIDGAPASTALHNGYAAAFANCPGISVEGSVEGQWSEATTKSVMLQFLSTHPGQLAGVVNGGGETNGVLQALEQTGHQPVPVGDSNPDEGSLVTLENTLPNDYVASTDPPVQTIDAALQVAIAVLQGQGLKYDAVVADPPQITGAAALDGWIQSGWTSSSAAQAPAPPGTAWLPPSELSSFFAHPKPLPELP